REGIVREIERLRFLVPFVEREVDNPAKLEPVLVDEVEIGTDARAGVARELVELLRIARDEEDGIALLQAELLADRLGALRADILGDRAGALERIVLGAPEDVAEARLALTLRPGVHAIAEGSGATGLRRDSPDLGLRIGLDHAGE